VPDELLFLEYTVPSWGLHAQVLETKEIPQFDLLTFLQWPLNHILQRWVYINNKIEHYEWLPFNEGVSLLHVASFYGLLSVLKAILETGVDVNFKDSKFGPTPLSRAAENGHEAVVKMLLEKGANVDSKNDNGQTPLSWAVENRHEAVVKLLLEKGASVDSIEVELSLATKTRPEVVIK